jgi:hypothetical protein
VAIKRAVDPLAIFSPNNFCVDAPAGPAEMPPAAPVALSPTVFPQTRALTGVPSTVLDGLDIEALLRSPHLLATLADLARRHPLAEQLAAAAGLMPENAALASVDAFMSEWQKAKLRPFLDASAGGTAGAGPSAAADDETAPPAEKRRRTGGGRP